MGRGVSLPSVRASHTSEKYLFLPMSACVTTKATMVPSGDTAGLDACTTLPMMRSAMAACGLSAGVADSGREAEVDDMADDGTRCGLA
jgi:hypothetical protein